MTYRTYITIIKNEKEFNQSICTDDFIDTVKILRENNEVIKITICCITTQEIREDNIIMQWIKGRRGFAPSIIGALKFNVCHKVQGFWSRQIALLNEKEEMNQETILDLMDKASLVGFDIHKLCDMIRAGRTERQCYSAIAKNIRITFEDQGFLMVDDHDYSN